MNLLRMSILCKHRLATSISLQKHLWSKAKTKRVHHWILVINKRTLNSNCHGYQYRNFNSKVAKRHLKMLLTPPNSLELSLQARAPCTSIWWGHLDLQNYKQNTWLTLKFCANCSNDWVCHYSTLFSYKLKHRNRAIGSSLICIISAKYNQYSI